MLPINLAFERYTGAGNLAEYTFDFKIADESEILVIVANAEGEEVQRVRGTDTSYLDSVEFDSVNGGGTVYLQANLDTGYEIYILLAPDEPVQNHRFRNKFDLTYSRIEAAFDQFVGYIQRLAYQAKFAIRLHDLDDPETFDPMLPQGVSDNTSALIPHVVEGGWAPVSSWTPVADLAAAVAAATAAAASAAASAASAAASAASAILAANVTPVITGSRGTPQNITAGGGIAFTGTAWQSTWYVQGDGAPTNVTVNPQIAPGTNVGQRLRIMSCSDANSLTLENGTGLDLNGTFVGVSNRVLELEWDGTNWFETGRR